VHGLQNLSRLNAMRKLFLFREGGDNLSEIPAFNPSTLIKTFVQY